MANTDHDITQILNQSKKTEDFQKISDILGKMSDPRRVQIFWILCHCEECVADLAEMTEMSSPAVSHHLRVLKECGLIESRRDGKEVCYRAAGSPLSALMHTVTEEIMAVSCPDAEILPKTGCGCDHHNHSEHSEDAHCCGHNHSHTHEKQYEKSDKSSVESDNVTSSETFGKASETSFNTSTDKAHDCCHINAHDTPKKSNTDYSNLAQEIHEYLSENLDTHITIESLSKHFCVNPTTIKTVFREAYGDSIAAHMKEHRMEKAASLLKESDLSIARIAEAVGFKTQSKFTQVFKETYHVLPKDYRNNR